MSSIHRSVPKTRGAGSAAWAVVALVIAALVLGAGCGDSSESTPKPPPSERAETPPQPAPAPAPPRPDIPAPPPDAAPPPTGAVPVPRGDATAGRPVYIQYCASCHGETGAGDGPVAVTLDPKPAHHNDGDYMNPLTDAYLFKVIQQGGQAVGKSPMMAPWGGTLSDEQIRNVIAFIRSLADPPYEP